MFEALYKCCSYYYNRKCSVFDFVYLSNTLSVVNICMFSLLLCFYFPGTLPDLEWPQHGAVIVVDVSVRYAKTLDPVLSNTYLNVKPGQMECTFSPWWSVDLLHKASHGKTWFILSE